eukprot:COSAG02_NODE_8183_length_2672_cov_4.315196_2_plen_207_part_00
MRVLGVSVIASVWMQVGLRACVFVRCLRGCVALIMCAGRRLYSTSLSGTVPYALCQTEVRSLDLHDCGITASSELASCSCLTVLDLSNNELMEVPPSLPHGLTHLYVNGNPLRTSTSTLMDVLANLGALAALDIQFLNVPLIFNSHNDASCLARTVVASYCYGPRVSAPTTCILGTHPSPLHLVCTTRAQHRPTGLSAQIPSSRPH